MQRRVGLVRFAIFFTGLLITLAILGIALEALTGFSLNGAVNQIVATIGATIDAGNRFYKKYETVPDKSFAWQASFKMTLVEMAISISLGAILIWFLLETGELGFGLDGTFLTILAVVLAITFAISLVAKRFVFVSGAKGAEKKHLKKLEQSKSAFD